MATAMAFSTKIEVNCLGGCQLSFSLSLAHSSLEDSVAQTTNRINPKLMHAVPNDARIYGDKRD